MTEIAFKSLFVKNFLSIGQIPLELNFSKGINLITGENKDKGGKNGIGKSTIADSIFWCLFGNTIRELKKENIQHNLNKDECCVVLEFDVKKSNETKNYKIKRILNPAKIEILCDNKDITLSTLPKNDDFIKSLINANEEVFNNAVIMSTNNTIPFMAQKKTEKRKFIEGILQLNIFGEMLLKTRAEYNDFKKENDILSNNFLNQQKNLDIFEKQKKEEAVKKQEKINNWNYNIEYNENLLKEFKNKQFPDIKETEDKIIALEDKLKQLKDFLKKYNNNKNDHISQKSTLLAEINNLKREKQKILDKGDICPTCNRQYCEDDIKWVKTKLSEIDDSFKEYEILLDKINVKKSECENNIKTIEDGIDKVNDKIKELNKFKLSIKDNQHEISKCEHEIKKFKQLIDEINKEKSSINVNLEETKKEIEKIENNLKKVKKTMQLLDSVKFILSEDGVKTYIVKKIIAFLNEKLNSYLQKLETPCKCVFDETFEETIYNENGKEVSYFNFSGGERKRIDVAILFMFQDVLRLHSGISYSLNIYDELFDSALDDFGTDKILNVLKDKTEKYDESVYIISHKTSTKTNIDNIILLEKENGETKIVS